MTMSNKKTLLQDFEAEASEFLDIPKKTFIRGVIGMSISLTTPYSRERLTFAYSYGSRHVI